MAEKKIGAAGGAEIAREDVLRAQAGGKKLRAVGFAQIEVNVLRRRLVARRLHVEPLKRIRLFAGAGFIEIFCGIGKLGSELGDEVGGNFVATWTDGGPEGGEQISGLAAEFELHATDGFLRDARESATPASMDGGDGALFGIDEENGDAIGGLNAEKDAGLICYGGVALAGFGAQLREDTNHVGVDLFEGKQLMVGSAESGLKLAAVFENNFPRVPFHEAEIERFFGFELTEAAGTRAEAVY